MGKLVDLTGKRFGRLIVIEQAGRAKNGRVKWLCICDCGNEKITTETALVDGRAKSCGCLKSEALKAAFTKHGLCNSKLYSVRKAMIRRCYKEKCAEYKNYGKRGITVCEEWLGENGFINFYNWAIKNGYKEGLSIDRIDNDGNYCPENCRWATKKEQMMNTRRNRWIDFNGETHTITEWSNITGIAQSTIETRLKRGYSIDDALTTPIPKRKPRNMKIEYNGESHTIPEWAEITGVSAQAIRRRINGGWSIENALTIPVSISNPAGVYNGGGKHAHRESYI